MANTSDIVSVQISVKDAAANVASFSTIAIFAKSPILGMATFDANPDGLSAMVTAGFALGSAAYRKALAIVAAETKPATFKVWGRTLLNAQAIKFTPTVTTTGYVYSLDVVLPAGTTSTVTYTVLAGATPTTIATAMVALLEALTGVSCADGTGFMTLTPTATGDRFHLRNVDRGLTVDDTSADAGIATDLAAAQLADPDFYGVILDSNSSAEIVACAAWCEANEKLFLGLSIDSEVYVTGSSDVVSTLKTANYTRSNAIVTRDSAGAIDAGLMSRQFSKDPGSSTWALKTIPGANVDAWNATELGFMKGKNAQFYAVYSGLSLTQNGSAAGGRFFDITYGVDWLKANMTAALLSYLANREKVDFNDVGIGELESPIRMWLTLAESAKLINPGWTVTLPKSAAIADADKAARNVPGIKFNAVLAGAIHKVNVAGTITL